MRAQVLTQAVIGHDTLTRKAGLVLGGSLFIALAAQVSVPFFPVPLTLQTLAILIVGLTFGARLGAATVLAYLAEGAMGLPVFAGAQSAASLVGPTAGFLYGFVAMAWLAGLAVERGVARGVVSTALVGIAVSALLYIPGLAWPALAMGKALPDLWAYWMAPFLLGDVVKAVIAAMVVWGGWTALKARKG
ncbi:biotin transporter BioY [Roseovarius autotrophicus]|uniref:biotin transporter BioY n=1 Tax=Roseovarius autotrophicus TaxID=2824121 RepID=UPI0019F20477|nr:biotin transporter BioY [Roseovarius autotrophicus]MBE0454096.1 biotin transporter BioY [Roseovarius sp.]